MVKQVYICDRCGKMEFRYVYCNEHVLPEGWLRLTNGTQELRTDIHLCGACCDAFESFLQQEADKRNNMTQATGLSF